MNTTVTTALEKASVLALLPGDASMPLEERIECWEAYCLTQPQVDTPLRHWFCNGMYAREFTVPAGTLLTGKVHLHDSIAMMIKGRVRVVSADGIEHDIVAPATFIQHAGDKRIGLVLEEMVWTTFHTCQATTVEAAELELVTNSRAEYERITGHISLIEGVPT
jgi:hypothetical protein